MYRMTLQYMKKFSKFVLPRLIFGLIFIYFYCDYLIYFVSQIQCEWPSLNQELEDGINPAYVLVLADTHLLGSRNGHWFDKLRREWQMQRAFQTAITLHKPQLVFILGDIFDEGKWCSDEEFNDYVARYKIIFAVPPSTQLHAIVGNHDIGFHYRTTPDLSNRFISKMSSSSVNLVSLHGNHFVLINSIAMEGDGCSLCSKAVKEIENIENILKCTMGSSRCNGTRKLDKFSFPIIMQHFPLYRESDSVCTESDSAPVPERNKLFEERFDCLSKESTEYLVEHLRPRAVFGGHTHHSCRVRHSFAPTSEHKTEFVEYTVPSFSWRYRADPKYYLVTVSPHEVQVSKCGLPSEWTMQVTAVIMVLALAFYLRSYCIRNSSLFGRKKWSGKRV